MPPRRLPHNSQACHVSITQDAQRFVYTVARPTTTTYSTYDRPGDLSSRNTPCLQSVSLECGHSPGDSQDIKRQETLREVRVYHTWSLEYMISLV